jgi:hypothetical protein
MTIETAIRAYRGMPDFPGDKGFSGDFATVSCSECRAGAQFPFDRTQISPLVLVEEWRKSHRCRTS